MLFLLRPWRAARYTAAAISSTSSGTIELKIHSAADLAPSQPYLKVRDGTHALTHSPTCSLVLLYRLGSRIICLGEPWGGVAISVSVCLSPVPVGVCVRS